MSLQYQELKGLSKELGELTFILNAFSEVATGKPDIEKPKAKKE